MSTFLVSVGVGLATAAILALSAVAFTLEYAVSRIANFAHGEFLTIGAYAAYSTQASFHQNVAGLIYLLLQRTRFGKAIRAVSQDRALARVSGIPARRIIMGTWVLAGAVAGFAGFALAATIGTFGPLLGFNFLLLTITATVAGGLGRPYATLGGALIVGLAIQIAGTYTSSAYELVFAFLLLVLLMLFRPNGVFVQRGSVTVRA